MRFMQAGIEAGFASTGAYASGATEMWLVAIDLAYWVAWTVAGLACAAVVALKSCNGRPLCGVCVCFAVCTA